MPGNRGIRHALASWIPNWLSNRVEKNTAYKVLYTAALVCDAVVETGLQGLRASWPGKGTPTGLPYIGQGRGIIRGTGETDDAYAARLRAWLTTWQKAGSAEALALYLQAYFGADVTFGGKTIVRVVDRAGNWVQANTDGTTSFVINAAWDWDEVLNPERIGWWSDIWVIIAIDGKYSYYTNLTSGAWTAAWGIDSAGGVGFTIPRADVDAVKTILSNFKGAHTWVQAVVFANDPGLFDPNAAVNPPNGDWGNWGKLVTGNHYRVARPDNVSGVPVRFMIPRGGG